MVGMMHRRALAAAFLVFGWFAMPVSAAEEAELAHLSAWTGEFQGVYRQYLMVLSQLRAIDAMSKDLHAHKIGHGKAAADMAAIEDRISAGLNRASTAREHLSEPPVVSEALQPVRKAALISHAYLGTFDKTVRKSHVDAVALFAAAGLGEDVAGRVMLRSLQQMMILLKSDTVLLNAKLPLYDRRQPEEQLTRAIIAENTAFVIIVDAIGLHLEGMDYVASEQIASVRAFLDRGMDAINRGRQVARQTWFLTPQARTVGKEAFQETFSVEERINMQLRAFARDIAGKISVEALAPVIETHNTRMRFLVEERLRLQEQRPVAAY